MDLPLFAFLGSAVIAYTVAADHVTALYRLLLFLCAVAIFYTLVDSGERMRDLAADGLVILVAGAGLYLVSLHDWSSATARFEVVGKLGAYLSQIVPRFGDTGLHWNVVRNGTAAVLGLALPIGVVRLLDLVRSLPRRNSSRSPRAPLVRTARALAVGLAAMVMPVVLMLTESRMPWLAYLAIALLAVIWWICGRVFGRHRLVAFLASASIISTAGLLAALTLPEIVVAVPGPNTAANRAEIYPQSWKLAQDAPFTGGGLGQFPSLYSTYRQGIPHALFLEEDSGNSAYLNVLVEQGWIGLTGLLAILAVAAYAAVLRLNAGAAGLQIAGVLGVAFFVIYGVTHAMLVATRVIPFALIPAALVIAESPAPVVRNRPSAKLLLTLTLGALVIVVSMPRQLAAGWFANLGAVEMAKVALADWPTNRWDDGSRIGELAAAEDLFLRSLAFDPENLTANHRLGLIHMLDRDYQSAIGYLKAAYALDPEHRGIQKALGQSYAWSGQFDRALVLLGPLPESANEMRVYEWWWGTQGRDDLSAHAAVMTGLLSVSSLNSK